MRKVREIKYLTFGHLQTEKKTNQNEYFLSLINTLLTEDDSQKTEE